MIFNSAIFLVLVEVSLKILRELYLLTLLLDLRETDSFDFLESHFEKQLRIVHVFLQ